MPLLTPTRIVVLAVSVFAFIFLWTFGGSRDLGRPVIPVGGPGRTHLTPGNIGKPAPKPATGHVPEVATRPLDLLEETPLPLSTSISTLTTSYGGIPSSTASEPKETPASQPWEGAEPSHTTAVGGPAPPYPTAKNATSQAHWNTTNPEINCKTFPGASDVMVVVKTTKQDGLITQLDNLLSCVPHFALFSDRAGMIRNYTIHDGLAKVTSTRKAKHEEFKDYEKLRTQADAKVGSLKRLDKWKMLPMVYEAYKMRPDMRFYLFIEADTSVSWTNLLQWIARLDSRIPYYIGAPLEIGTMKFIQAGPGILVSNTALQRFAKAYDERYESEWEDRVERGCCGDVVLGTAMADAHVEVYNAFPNMHSDNPALFEWSQNNWCSPPVSWKNVSGVVLEEAWKFEKNWTSENGQKEPYLMRDAFAKLVQSHLLERTDDWDNLSHDTEIVSPLFDDPGDDDFQEWHKIDEELRQAAESWQACQKVCEAVEDCHQWRFNKRGESECHLGKTIRLGVKAQKVEGQEGWTSGWILDRIRKSTRDWECKDVKWPFQQ